MNEHESGIGPQAVPRIEFLSVKNYRALHGLELKRISPLTVFLGPNGSGKSTIFDVFAFLAECFLVGLRKAWNRRGRFKELRTRDTRGPIEIELKYREKPRTPVITYHMEIDEDLKGPFVHREWLRWTRKAGSGRPFNFLDFTDGSGVVATGEMPDQKALRINETLDSREMLAVNTLGQFAKHPRVKRPAAVHFGLVSFVPVGRQRTRLARGRAAGAAIRHRRQPRQRHPVP